MPIINGKSAKYAISLGETTFKYVKRFVGIKPKTTEKFAQSMNATSFAIPNSISSTALPKESNLFLNLWKSSVKSARSRKKPINLHFPSSSQGINRVNSSALLPESNPLSRSLAANHDVKTLERMLAQVENTGNPKLEHAVIESIESKGAKAVKNTGKNVKNTRKKTKQSNPFRMTEQEAKGTPLKASEGKAPTAGGKGTSPKAPEGKAPGAKGNGTSPKAPEGKAPGAKGNGTSPKAPEGKAPGAKGNGTPPKAPEGKAPGAKGNGTPPKAPEGKAPGAKGNGTPPKAPEGKAPGAKGNGTSPKAPEGKAPGAKGNGTSPKAPEGKAPGAKGNGTSPKATEGKAPKSSLEGKGTTITPQSAPLQTNTSLSSLSAPTEKGVGGISGVIKRAKNSIKNTYNKVRDYVKEKIYNPLKSTLSTVKNEAQQVVKQQSTTMKSTNTAGISSEAKAFMRQLEEKYSHSPAAKREIQQIFASNLGNGQIQRLKQLAAENVDPATIRKVLSSNLNDRNFRLLKNILKDPRFKNINVSGINDHNIGFLEKLRLDKNFKGENMSLVLSDMEISQKMYDKYPAEFLASLQENIAPKQMDSMVGILGNNYGNFLTDLSKINKFKNIRFNHSYTTEISKQHGTNKMLMSCGGLNYTIDIKTGKIVSFESEGTPVLSKIG